MDPVATCRSCHAPIVWTKTGAGKNMPMDLTPSEAGTFYLFRMPDRIDAVHAASVEDPRAAKAFARGDKRYTSHFSSCPNADHHRKTKP